MIAEPPVESVELEVLEPEYAAARALVAEKLGSDVWKRIDEVEAELEQLPQERCPLRHVFTPNLYVRECFLAKGKLVTTRIHLTEHPFVISMGIVSIWDDEHGWQLLRAPFTGITQPGTRRILLIHEDTIFSTFHVTNKTDPDEIVKEITFVGGKFAELRGAAAQPTDHLLK